MKISIIGAGSGAFSLSLIRDICLTKNLEGCTISLMDIDPGRLEGAYAVCQRYAREVGFHLTLEKTLERHACLEGADFVINTALAAGHHRLRAGWEIARRHGYNWGGSFHVMYDEAFWINFYQFRLFESLAEDILKICPEAYHLMVANPVISGVTYLGRRYPRLKLVGLCHGYSHIYHIADFLGMERDKITFEIPGVNHFVWLTHFYYKGENAFPLLEHWIANEAQNYWAEGKTWPLSPKAVDLYRRFGALPIGDTANWSGASWPYDYHSDEQVERSWGEKPQDGWNRYFSGVSANAEEFQQIAADPDIRVTEKYPPQLSGEPMIPIIESVACDIPRIIIGNILDSAGFVPGIPLDFEVEIPILFSKRGFEGIQTKGLPRPLIARILRDRVAPIEIELEAYRRGSRNLLLELILIDPWSRSKKQAEAFLEEILAMPEHEVMRKHYQ